MSHVVCAMRIRNNRRRIVAMVGLGAGIVAASNVVCAQIPCEYEVQIIASPLDCGLGTVNTFGLGLNEHGDVVGYYRCPLWNHTEAFLWTAEEGFVTLQRPQGVSSAIAVDINDAGIICGTVFVSGLDNRGFVYENGEWTILPPVVDVPGARSSANTINNAGTVVGQRSLTEEPNPKNAYIWSAEEGFTDLGVLKGPNSGAFDISQGGLIGGWTGTTFFADDSIAVLWENERPVEIGSIPGGFATYVRAVAENGTALLNGRIKMGESSVLLAHLWQDGKFTLITPVRGFDTSGAAGMNDALLATGRSVRLDAPTDPKAYLWDSGSTFDLNDLLAADSPIVVETGASISNAGQIVGNGKHDSGDIVASLLTPLSAPLGDLNHDCQVGVADLLILLGHWGPCVPGRHCIADLNGDGIVGVVDLLLLLGNWG